MRNTVKPSKEQLQATHQLMRYKRDNSLSDVALETELGITRKTIRLRYIKQNWTKAEIALIEKITSL